MKCINYTCDATMVKHRSWDQLEYTCRKCGSGSVSCEGWRDVLLTAFWLIVCAASVAFPLLHVIASVPKCAP